MDDLTASRHRLLKCALAYALATSDPIRKSPEHHRDMLEMAEHAFDVAAKDHATHYQTTIEKE